MNADFPRVLTLLRKERGISQKLAASKLGISQALLSHYEKGIRECGLDFLIRCADFYEVSCDYMLGRSPDRTGSKLTVEDIPEPDTIGKENVFKAGVLPVLNKKLIANSLNILFDLLSRSKCKPLINEVSSFLMLSVYRMFRLVYGANPRNQNALFTIPETVSQCYADAAMQVSFANAQSITEGDPVADMERIENVDPLYVTTESLSQDYPLFASSLLNLVQNSEARIAYPTHLKR
ncbi:helix-turn-helix domain-containing protein [Marasmitruncus massiliensis]|uniref:helix-turn-helix domain-containing protein n=1 Tax=Marasmitruncus massiliensis TaxID=1944642 RepID=UPI000C7AF4C9|nr:helix-turn-helix transcriptional regulator [Marasmitruncus massiliensis]MBE6907731.1 helix-turn-helix transcriptional regulator [Oscillospiraceae bacterium]